MPGMERLEWECVYKPAPLRFEFAIHAQDPVKRGCQAFLAHLWDNSTLVPPIASVSIVCEFLEVFSDDLPGMIPDCEIDFCIDLDPSSHSIYIPSYCKAPTELRNLDCWSC